MRRDDGWHLEQPGLRFRRWVGGGGGFGVHLGAFLVGATALTLLNLATTPGDLWFWRPLVVWGVVLVIHGALVVGGLARAAADEPPATRRAPEVAAPARRARIAPALSRLTAGALEKSGTGSRAAVRAATSLASVARDRVRTNGTVLEHRDGWTPAEADAVASWGQTTDTWANARPPRASEGAVAWSAAPEHGSQPLRDGSKAATQVLVAASDLSAPAATGRFGVPPKESPTPAPAVTNGAVADGHAAADRVPAAIEALWAFSGRSGPAAPAGAFSAPGAPRGSASTPAGPDGSSPRPAVRAGSPGGQDIVLQGPMPVDAKDPRWRWVEAEAAAWLARREADAEQATAPSEEPAHSLAQR